ncbi:molybdopterin-dependent oxidoreductase [Dehalobacterium formicoaceticum]|uniref:Molybdopterin-dependent oxidoreductase n=1 Tax=Dehalobacterium formicoaceticum TaxID=51515 RepID=A0ABT1Y3A0_9FIRM|nr:molybdopterin-dependent oxidoreductase [Dehalobacterium formicoaceticum]MCR6544630.1 molybdopterin-dependent oxidoreductase [Dehalobacterium formicoaceticum]
MTSEKTGAWPLKEDLDKYAVATQVPVWVGGEKVLADRVVKTACPHNCYDTCGMLVYVKDEKVIKIEGDPDHPITRGHLCLKGYANVQKINSPDRVKYPLMRVGNRGEGKFKRISWDEAFAYIVEKLEDIKEKYGGEALAEYAYSGNREHMAKAVSKRFLNLYGASQTVGSFCVLSGVAGSYHTLGFQHTMSPEIWSEHTELIMLVGRNPSATNPHLYPFLYHAMERGAKLIVVDPYVTAVASKADVHLRPRPGTDGAMALGMIRHIIENDLHNMDFIAKYTHGFEDLVKLVQEWTLDKTAEVTGIPADQIKLAAEMYATHDSHMECGYGQQRYSNGHQTQRALACLAAVCGHIGKKSANYNFMDAMGFPSLSGFVACSKVSNPEGAFLRKTRMINIAAFAKAMRAAEDPPLKAVISWRGGLVSQQPYVDYTIEALKALDLFVVIEQFMTDDTDWADIVLPACHFLEQYGLHPSYWHHYNQIVVPVCQPYYEAVPDIEIWSELARRMGYEEYFPRDITGLDWIRVLIEYECNVDEMVSPKGPALLPESWCPTVPYHDYQFTTPTGKIELYSVGMEQRGKEVTGDFEPVPHFVEPDESPMATPELAAKYPLTIISQHPAFRTHSQFYNLPWIKEIEGPAKVFINKKDALDRGIQDGDQVAVFNDRGRLENILAKVSNRVQAGVVELSSGMWVKLGWSVNKLTALSYGGPREFPDGIMHEYQPFVDGNTTAYFNTLADIEKMQ